MTKNLPRIAEIKLFQGDNWVDHFAYGEGNYGPASDNMVAVKGTQRPEDFTQWGRIAREVAKAGLPMHSHTTLEDTAQRLPRPDRANQQGLPGPQPALDADSRRAG